MPPVEFEPTISAGERPQNNALDHTATGTGPEKLCSAYFADVSLGNLKESSYKARKYSR